MRRQDLVWAADSFGEVVRRAREVKGLTQKELAKNCDDISGMYISQIESGQRVPRMKICRRLAQALDLDERRLLLLAYRSNAPKEIRELLDSEGSSEEALSNRFLSLLRIANSLPADSKDQLAKAW